MKITVNQQSKGKPENPYSGTTQVTNGIKFHESHPELICLTPTGELAGEGTYECGKAIEIYYDPFNRMWHTTIKGIDVNISRRFETTKAYIVTTPANEQPKEVWQIKHTKGWSDISQSEYENYKDSNAELRKKPAPSLAPVDESVEERAERVYGNDPNMYGAQRDGFIAGYNECLKEHVRLDDVVRVLDGYVWDGKILASDLSEIANKLYSLNKNTNE